MTESTIMMTMYTMVIAIQMSGSAAKSRQALCHQPLP
jgi:hypothetical protein